MKIKRTKVNKINEKYLKLARSAKKTKLSRYWKIKNRKLELRQRFGKKKYITFRQRFVLKRKNPNRKKYYLFFSKKKNNVFLTLTDVRGSVIISQSAGSCKITTKKKKRSPDTLKTIAASVAKLARLKNIKYLFKFFIKSNQARVCKPIFESCKKQGLLILQAIVVKSRPHSLHMRRKKLKRL